jgi:quercetin dioxygenase-like cupin family protein
MHRHPGMQLAWIESGTLTYTVVEGDVTVHEADGGTRSIEAGQTGTIGAGEWIAEDERIVHFGENRGSSVVVILASSLLEADQPAAVPVPSASS